MGVEEFDGTHRELAAQMDAQYDDGALRSL
jgi:hypothetical protein